MPDRYDDTDLRRGSARHDLVERLQRDLIELGFNVIDKADGIFGRYTYWAVREFQAYAKMDHVAMLASPGSSAYADRLGQVATGSARYQGAVSGVVDGATRAALETWLASKWRCPVVVEAWTMSRQNRHSLVADNIWRHDHIADTKPRMFVTDLSNHFGQPAAGSGGRVVLGDFVPYLKWKGPRSVPPSHTQAHGEMLPQSLLGKPLDALTPTERSTFKVVRAVSEVECMGYFDSVNSYDNAFVSVGPCHWTLGIVSEGGNVSEGEMCGFLSFLKHFDPGAHDTLLGHFGVGIDEQWIDQAGVANGKTLFDNNSRKYTGWISMTDESGRLRRVVEREEDGDFFKTWHWFYRFVAAGRDLAGYRAAMWPMARMRLRDVSSASLGNGSTVGQVFTSELAMAILLRWHIRLPGHIVSGGKAGQALRDVFAAVGAFPPAPGQEQHYEDRLLATLQARAATAGGDLPKTIGEVVAWPAWAAGANPRKYQLSPSIGGLSRSRDSFALDNTALPPAPY